MSAGSISEHMHESEQQHVRLFILSVCVSNRQANSWK